MNVMPIWVQISLLCNLCFQIVQHGSVQIVNFHGFKNAFHLPLAQWVTSQALFTYIFYSHNANLSGHCDKKLNLCLLQEIGARKDVLDFEQFHKFYNILMFENQKSVS